MSIQTWSVYVVRAFINFVQLQYFSRMGGSSVGDCTRSILKALLSDSMLVNLNWRGVHGKQSIADTKLCQLIIGKHWHSKIANCNSNLDAVLKRNFPDASVDIINRKIQRWIQRTRPRNTEVDKDTMWFLPPFTGEYYNGFYISKGDLFGYCSTVDDGLVHLKGYVNERGGVPLSRFLDANVCYRPGLIQSQTLLFQMDSTMKIDRSS